MIEIGPLVASATIQIIDVADGDLLSCPSTPCIGGDRIFDTVPMSMGLHEGDGFDPTFSVTSQVLSADHEVRCQ